MLADLFELAWGPYAHDNDKNYLIRKRSADVVENVVDSGVAEIHNREPTLRVTDDISDFQITVMDTGGMDISSCLVDRLAVEEISKDPGIDIKNTQWQDLTVALSCSTSLWFLVSGFQDSLCRLYFAAKEGSAVSILKPFTWVLWILKGFRKGKAFNEGHGGSLH
ncbi:hypothetical protein B0H14DRAFT_2573899 [Mycena olivaceomarginata]|nr:hypothetical protein B0H14DRAFT_2573899 [Mycena olivaceomarginata]